MSAGEETEKDKSRGRRRSRSLLTMALACLGLGCAPVSSKGTVYKTYYLFCWITVNEDVALRQY